ncbi:MAG: glycosyltransferase family 4 protein [Thermoleophilia bacterium]|nr:glycosyltransferase family 4 protein [Thermoleophilia bacterium]
MAGFRVLHVTDYASMYEGAFIRQLRMLDEDLRSRGARPSALCATSAALERDWARTLQDDGWTLREVPAGSTRPQRHVARAIADAVLEEQPDVVHVHFGTYDLSTRRALRSVRRLLGPAMPKLVWHYRTALETPVAERSPLRRAKDYLKFERAGRDVDLFVGVTRALADEVAARGAARERSVGIVAGCDTERFRRDSANRDRVRDRLGVADDEVMVLHMGWSWYRKGGDLLAEAMRSLETGSGPRIRAFSIGAPDDELLGSVQPLPMSDRVHEYHQASDIFVSASRSEGFGNGLVEAMACERVAVAAAAEGQVETFAGLDGVETIPIEDSRALAAAIRDLVRRRASWPALGQASRRHVLEHHSMRRWARDMADAYARLRPERLASSDARTGSDHAAEVA